MGLNPGSDCTFTSVFGTRRRGQGGAVHLIFADITALLNRFSLANGIYIIAELNAIHNDEEKLKTSNTK